MNILQKIPKVDLHIHLDGSVRASTILEIALEEGIELPDQEIAVLNYHLQANESCNSLPEYLSKFDLPLQCLQSAKALRRVAYEIVEDASRQNVKYIEVRFAPLLHTNKGLSLDDVIENVLTGFREAEEKLKITARIIVVCLRSHPIERNTEIVQLARQFLGKGVVGVDLAGDEANFPPQLHRSVFLLANLYGIPITIHAGEAGGAKNIFESVKNMFACRIGHGVRLKENQELMQWIKSHNITLEMCVSSNIQTKAVASWSEHPIKEYYDQGILVTVNTDNTTVSNTNITKEYETLIERYRFSIHDIRNMIFNSLRASFLEEKEKKTMIQEFHNNFLALGL